MKLILAMMMEVEDTRGRGGVEKPCQAYSYLGLFLVLLLKAFGIFSQLLPK
jgi:hypothetical protein